VSCRPTKKGLEVESEKDYKIAKGLSPKVKKGIESNWNEK